MDYSPPFIDLSGIILLAMLALFIAALVSNDPNILFTIAGGFLVLTVVVLVFLM